MMLRYFNKFITKNNYLKNFILAIQNFIETYIFNYEKDKKPLNKLKDLFIGVKDYFDGFKNFFIIKSLESNSIFIKRNSSTEKAVFLFFKSFYIKAKIAYVTYVGDTFIILKYLRVQDGNLPTALNILGIEYNINVEEIYLSSDIGSNIMDEAYVFDDLNHLLVMDTSVFMNYKRIYTIGIVLTPLASTSSKFDYDNVLLDDYYYCFLYEFFDYYFKPKNFDFYFLYYFEATLKKLGDFYCGYLNFTNLDFSIVDYSFNYMTIWVFAPLHTIDDTYKIYVGRDSYYSNIDYLLFLYNENLFSLASTNVDIYNSYILNYSVDSNYTKAEASLLFFPLFYAENVKDDLSTGIDFSKLHYKQFFKDGITEICIVNTVTNKPVLYIGLPKFFKFYKSFKFSFKFVFNISNESYIVTNSHYRLSNSGFIDVAPGHVLFFNSSQASVIDYVSNSSVFTYFISTPPLGLEIYNNEFFLITEDRLVCYDGFNYVDYPYSWSDSFYYIRNNDKLYFFTETLNLYYFNFNTKSFVNVGKITSIYTKVKSPKMIFDRNNLNLYYANVYIGSAITTLSHGNLVLSIYDLNSNPYSSSIYKTDFSIEPNIVKNANYFYHFKDNVLLSKDKVLFKFKSNLTYHGKYENNKIYVVQYDSSDILVSTINL